MTKVFVALLIVIFVFSVVVAMPDCENDEENDDLSFRILGGDEAPENKYPFIVSIQVGTGKPGFNIKFCGGAIIHPHWVLTASHCFDGADFQKIRLYALAGVNDLSKTTQEAQMREIDGVYQHPLFTGATFPHDIALLHIGLPFELNKFVQTIELPERDSIPFGVATIMGWGLSGDLMNRHEETLLQHAQIHLFPVHYCKEFWNKDDLAYVSNNDICGNDLEDGITSCTGDSGGPIIQYQDGQPVLIGVTSFGDYPCGDKQMPTVYTRVSAYIDYIQKFIECN